MKKTILATLLVATLIMGCGNRTEKTAEETITTTDDTTAENVSEEGAEELTMEATGCAATTFMPFEVYIIAGILYWILIIIIELVSKTFQRKSLSF